MKQVMRSILKQYIGQMIILVIFIFINMYILTLPAKIIGIIIDYMADMEANKTAITTYLLYLVGSVILYLLTRIPWRTLSTYISRTFERDLKNIIFNQFIRLKLEDIQNIKNGELMSYFTKDIMEIRACLYRIMSYGIRIIAIGTVGIYTMVLGVNTKLTIVALIPILITAFAIIKIKKYVEQNFKKARQYFTELSEFVQESTDSIRTTKAYSGEMSQVKRFIQKNRKLKQSNIAVDTNSTLLSTSINIGFGLCYGITILFGSHLVLQNNITLGDFIAFNGYIGLFYGPVSWLPGIISRYKRAQISYHRLDKLFNLEREKINLKNIEKQEEIKGDIIIKDLNYNYPTTIEVALSHINLTIPEGRTLGIIGTIGSGKTTLMNLLLKLYPVERGKITIDGKDINDLPIESLRNNICYITQDNFLFSTTLRENISLFKEGYDEEDIIKSTKQAKMKEEIDEMENGIDTIIGERGVDLSGGQKQRVVISRAFLQASNIVIFDDTFSALDNKTEEQVLNNVRNLTKGKTCIIISNRISDVKDADEIIVLEEGKIIQKGDHQNLINQEGLYQKFYLQQSTELGTG
jgi:ATP-binding cassette subfamily B protein